ncbi:hypothetical protein N9C09_01155 [Aquiluna sp.]|nr:hypothetical protein [Aquiluna sp.]
MSKPTIAILGSGNIGVDLAERILHDSEFKIAALIGRRSDSPGLQRMADKGVSTFAGGLEEFLDQGVSVDGFFDATSAFDHVRHWQRIETETEAWAIDLTPSRIGLEVIPILDKSVIQTGNKRNFNMVTCGGQSSSPIVAAMCAGSGEIASVEISSSIASDSAGPATRKNLDHYIEATEATAARLAGAPSKAILVLNPALPQVMMRTSVTIEASSMDIKAAEKNVIEMINRVSADVPGYKLVLPPTEIAKNVFLSTVSVEGAGYYLPNYSGNLDIINAAAIQTARILCGMSK